MVRDRMFIFGMHIQLIKPFQMPPEGAFMFHKRFICYVQCDLDLGDMTLGQGDDLPLGFR